MILVDIYADEGITGTAMSKREEFKRLLNDAKVSVNALFIWMTERFVRVSYRCSIEQYGNQTY